MEARNRYGVVFKEEEEVRIYGNYHPSLNNRILIIRGIIDFEACESGKMVQLEDKETGKLLKKKLDTNWLLKIKK